MKIQVMKKHLDLSFSKPTRLSYISWGNVFMSLRKYSTMCVGGCGDVASTFNCERTCSTDVKAKPTNYLLSLTGVHIIHTGRYRKDSFQWRMDIKADKRREITQNFILQGSLFIDYEPILWEKLFPLWQLCMNWMIHSGRSVYIRDYLVLVLATRNQKICSSLHELICSVTQGILGLYFGVSEKDKTSEGFDLTSWTDCDPHLKQGSKVSQDGSRILVALISRIIHLTHSIGCVQW